MSLTERVLKTIFSKRIDRETAINRYLSKFELNELSYLHGVYITSLETRIQRRPPQPYEINGNDPYPYIDLATYLFAKVKFQETDINHLAKGESDIRAVYRVELTKAFLKLNSGAVDLHKSLSNFRITHDIIIDDKAGLIRNAFTNLNRIHKHGTRAQLIE